MRLPDHGCGNDNPEIVEGVSQYVDQDCLCSEIMPLVGSLLMAIMTMIMTMLMIVIMLVMLFVLVVLMIIMVVRK
jgi:hypothetical protein